MCPGSCTPGWPRAAGQTGSTACRDRVGAANGWDTGEAKKWPYRWSTALQKPVYMLANPSAPEYTQPERFSTNACTAASSVVAPSGVNSSKQSSPLLLAPEEH